MAEIAPGESSQFYVTGSPRSLDVEIGRYAFKAGWWGFIPAQEWSNEKHAHVCAEIMYVYEGEGVVEAGGRTSAVRKGHVIIAFPGDEHRIFSARGAVMGAQTVGYEVSLKGSSATGGETFDAGLNLLVRSFLISPERIRLDTPDGCLGFDFEMMRRAMEGRSLDWRKAAGVASRAVVLDTARLFAPLGSPLPEPQEPGKWVWVNWSGKLSREDSLLDKTGSYLAAHYRENLRIEGVARRLGVSVRKLQRKFEGAGYSFRSLLHGVRLEAARYFLMNTNLSVEDVAEEVGLAEPSYFSAIFKKRYGVTPLKYRSLRDA